MALFRRLRIGALASDACSPGARAAATGWLPRGSDGGAWGGGAMRRGVSAAEASAGEEARIEVAPSAVERLKELTSESSDTRGMHLRVMVEGGGCSGFQYKFSLDDKVTDDDRVFEKDGVRVVCDSLSLDFLKGSTVEYSSDLMRSAFQVANNPQSESACGCGTSFVAKME
eukprot:evm.model.scf_77.4 EVM.evm.TU.scf_77.4   scf_77:77135-81546(-)